MSLQGRTVALAEGRQLEELAQLLEKEGATTLRCPLLSIVDQPESALVIQWLHDLVAGKFAYVVLLTGEGLRRLLTAAERERLREQVIAALGQARTITRGPKPGMALKEIGLAPYKIASAPTTEGVIATLKQESLVGVGVGVQLYSESNPPLTEYLQSIGAIVQTVSPYIYAPSADSERVVDLIARLSRGTIDCIVFTSSPQIDRLIEVAAERKLETELAAGWQRVKIAAVGPLVKDKLLQVGARADIMPAQGFHMKNLVQHIKRAFD